MTDLMDNPLFDVIRRVRIGELRIDEGERAAADPSIVRTLVPEFAGGLSEASFNAAAEGKWFEAQAVHRLLVAAVLQLPDDRAITDAYRMRQVVVGDWIVVAHRALVSMESPDGRLLRSARLLGEPLLERAAAVGHVQTVASVHFRLATAHLDPFKGRASPLTGPQPGQAPWKAALNPELGQSVLGVGPTEWAMPDPRTAVDYAATHLRLALAGPKPHPGAAKALAQTLDTQISLGEPVDRAELTQVCRKALEGLTGPGDQAIFEEVAEILARRS